MYQKMSILQNYKTKSDKLMILQCINLFNKLNKLNINVNPAYGEVRGTTVQQQQVTYEEILNGITFTI